MTPAKKPPHSRPVPMTPMALPAAKATAAAVGLPLGLAGALLGLVALLVAAAAAYGLALMFDGAAAWVAPLSAVLGVAVAGVPLAVLTLRLAREAQPSFERTSPVTEPAAGLVRPLFMDLAHREWARARRYGNGAALLLVEVDRHARLCEARGPAAGEAVLAELLRQTAPTLRPADILTRFSDTQMAVFLAQADATGALDVAERIRERAEQLELPFDNSNAQRLRVTVSAGVAHLRPAHLNLQAVVDDAEDAVAVARHAGGNCVRAASPEAGRSRTLGGWRDERRARPKQGGPAK